METAFFVASKVLWTLVRPDTWIALLVVLAFVAMSRWRMRQARVLLLGALALILTLGFLPVGGLLLRPLEEHFPARPDVAEPAGIIILGGGEDAAMSSASGQPELNDGAERLVLGLALAMEHPGARVIFTGGNGSLLARDSAGAAAAGDLISRLGIDPARVILEPAARNTAENARLTLEMVEEASRGPWILVTSGFHMPRSVGAFCQAGWRNVVPYPVDFRAAELGALTWDLSGRLDLLGLAIKEWIGLLAYDLTGRSTGILPRGC